MRVTPLLPSDLQSTTGGAASVSSTPITGATATASVCAIRGAVEEVYEMNASFGSSSSAAAD